MQRYLLDTNILIQLIKSKTDIVENFFKDFSSENIYLPHVAAGELIQGARDKQELKKITNLVNSFEIDWGNLSSNQLAQEILVQNTLQNGIDLFDAIIASIAIENGYTLITLNLKHFKVVKNLDVIRPTLQPMK